MAVGVGEAQAAAADKPGIIATILKWTPLLAEGFALNIAMSFLAMAIGTAVGVPLGLAQMSLLPPVRAGSWFVTQFFRNSPTNIPAKAGACTWFRCIAKWWGGRGSCCWCCWAQ